MVGKQEVKQFVADRLNELYEAQDARSGQSAEEHETREAHITDFEKLRTMLGGLKRLEFQAEWRGQRKLPFAVF